MMNQTIELQLNHRTIRSFSDKTVSDEIINTLIQVAQRTATSHFMQCYSIIRVTDEMKKKRIAEIGNQPYIAEAPVLFVMVADMYRNKMMSESLGGTSEALKSFDRFFASATDAILASQNIVIAAESLGLGGVLLGSILNDAAELGKLLELPEFVVPVLGVALGYPNQEPQLKPRLPQKFMYMENTYNLPDIAGLADYDAEVTTYYDLRDANKRVDAFTTQVVRSATNLVPTRKNLLPDYKKKGIIEY